MVSVKQFDDDYCLLKQNSGSEPSKCSGVPWRGWFSFFLLFLSFFLSKRGAGVILLVFILFPLSHICQFSPHGLCLILYTIYIQSHFLLYIYGYFQFFKKIEKFFFTIIVDLLMSWCHVKVARGLRLILWLLLRLSVIMVYVSCTWFKYLWNLLGNGNGIPFYCLGTEPVRGNDAYRASSCHAEEEQSLLDSLLLAQVYLYECFQCVIQSHRQRLMIVTF